MSNPSKSIANWEPGLIRVFLSHSAIHKEFVGEVAKELALSGIHGFVAHDTIENEKPWQDQIENALRSCQAFVAILHPEFDDSPWCHQEVGWALWRGVPFYAIRFGAKRLGFIGSLQWPQGQGRSAEDIAKLIYKWVASSPGFSASIVEGLLKSLEAANDYREAGKIVEDIISIKNMNQSAWAELDRIYWANKQVHGSTISVRPQLKDFYLSNNREWPPQKLPARV